MSNYRTARILQGMMVIFVVFATGYARNVLGQDGTYPANVDPANFHPGYFALISDRADIPQDVLLNDEFVGVKIRYRWKALEPGAGTYDFSAIERDLETLKSRDKRLWIQIEYVQWNGSGEPFTPQYMWNDSSYGGDSRYYGNFAREVQDGGWYPYFWNAKVRERLNGLIAALGRRFSTESHVEGITISETSVAVPAGQDCSVFLSAIQDAAITAKDAFGNKIVFQMVNFACFDLPRHINWLVDRGVGLGTPDTFNFKDSLTNEIYPLMLENRSDVAIGPDVQWDNYERNNMSVSEIRDHAIASTDPWYMFWEVREPYFSEQVLQAVFARPLPAAERFYSSNPDARTSSGARPKPPQLVE